MLLPYNVDRPLKRTPFVTYTLLGLNIFIFLMTVLVSNTNLPSDQVQARVLIRQLLKDDKGTAPNIFEEEADSEESEAESEDSDTANQQLIGGQLMLGQTGGTPEADQEITESDQLRALVKVQPRLNTPEGARDLYLIANARETFVLAPHYSVLNIFAYRPIEPSPGLKLLGLFGSMFLHGGLMHLAGNMLFLWVFGRALEEFLGYKFYTGIYLLCGVAATLLYHIITMQFSPNTAGVPLVGASGAISGVMGLFAIRFYRTKVRIFYISLFLILGIPVIGPLILIGMILGLLLVGFLFFLVTQSVAIAGTLAVMALVAALFVFGRNWAWGAFRAPSMWVIGVYIVVFNIRPAIMDMINQSQSSTAYWAHLGGFACGALYAFLIGGIEEGKSEYELEDAQTALHTSGTGDALDRAMRILDKDPENVQANEVAAIAYNNMSNVEAATPHFVKAIMGYSRIGERQNAARLYSIAAPYNPYLPLPGAILAGIAAEFAKNNSWDEAATVLVRVIEEFPHTAEAEVALLRAAQIWMRQYDDPFESVRMLETFLETYPASSYIPQAEAALAAAREAAQIKYAKMQEEQQQGLY